MEGDCDLNNNYYHNDEKRAKVQAITQSTNSIDAPSLLHPLCSKDTFDAILAQVVHHDALIYRSLRTVCRSWSAYLKEWRKVHFMAYPDAKQHFILHAADGDVEKLNECAMKNYELDVMCVSPSFNMSVCPHGELCRAKTDESACHNHDCLFPAMVHYIMQKGTPHSFTALLGPVEKVTEIIYSSTFGTWVETALKAGNTELADWIITSATNTIKEDRKMDQTYKTRLGSELIKVLVRHNKGLQAYDLLDAIAIDYTNDSTAKRCDALIVGMTVKEVCKQKRFRLATLMVNRYVTTFDREHVGQSMLTLRGIVQEVAPVVKRPKINELKHSWAENLALSIPTCQEIDTEPYYVIWVAICLQSDAETVFMYFDKVIEALVNMHSRYSKSGHNPVERSVEEYCMAVCGCSYDTEENCKMTYGIMPDKAKFSKLVEWLASDACPLRRIYPDMDEKLLEWEGQGLPDDIVRKLKDQLD